MGTPRLSMSLAALAAHTRTVFDADLHELNLLIREMAATAQREIERTIETLSIGKQSIPSTKPDRNDDMRSILRAIQEKSVNIIALRQPLAIDLREAISAMQIANNLERIATLAGEVAECGRAMASRLPESLMSGQAEMSRLVLARTNAAFRSYEDRDIKRALLVWSGDQDVDRMNNRISEEAIAYMAVDVSNMAAGMQALFCVKDLERIGDHATNIAEVVYYVGTGHIPEGERPKISTTRSIGAGWTDHPPAEISLALTR